MTDIEIHARPPIGTTRAIIVALILVALAPPKPATAQEVDGPAAMVNRLFDAMRARDTTAIRQAFHPEGRLMTAGRDRAGIPVVQTATVDAFVRAVASARARLDERLSDVEVRMDDGLATVWARYVFYADTTFTHCGVDAFQLAQTPEGWKIIQVADTRRREGCDGVSR
jgi:hypothetical protein